jgi:F-type H+-transporting ATPase subunit a
MTQLVRRAVVTILFFLILSPGLLAATSTESEEPLVDVMGKVVDKDYFEFLNIKFPLPRILLVEGSWYFFGSTKSAVDSGEFQVIEGSLVRADGAGISLDMSITAHLVFVWIGIFLVLLITFMASSRYRRGTGATSEPKGIAQNLFEVFFVFIRDQIAKEFIPSNKYEKFVPYLFSVFMVISFMNLFGLFPWGISPTANITSTAILAMITFVVTQFNGTRDHWRHVFAFPGVHPAMWLILTPVEILGLFTKPFALAIRLFANMLSGKILIVCILGLIFIFTDIFGLMIGASSSVVWVALTALLYILKGFIALLQAYIFTLLSAVFIGMAVEEHHHDDHETSVATATEVEV